MPSLNSQGTIRELTASCVAQLRSLLRNQDGFLLEKAELEKAEKEAHRFDLWAANIGVFAAPKFSLDYRLRNAPDISRVVYNMIDVVKVRAEYGMKQS
jgi:hypothetical protein